jgi:hypothetical protein
VVENPYTLSPTVLSFQPVSPLVAVADVPFQGRVGTLQLPNALALPEVTINWGDGAASPGSLLTHNHGQSYEVDGATTYLQSGHFNIAVSFTFSVPAPAPATAPVGTSAPPNHPNPGSIPPLRDFGDGSQIVQVTFTEQAEVTPGGNESVRADLSFGVVGDMQSSVADGTGQVPWQRLPEPLTRQDLEPAAGEASLAELMKMLGPNPADNRTHFGWADAGTWQNTLLATLTPEVYAPAPLVNPEELVGHNPAAVRVPSASNWGWAPRRRREPVPLDGLEALAHDQPGAARAPGVPASAYGRLEPSEEADRELAALLTPAVKDRRDTREKEIQYDVLCSWCVASYFFAVFMDGQRAAGLLPVPPLSGGR